MADFIPLFTESAATIRARLNADANVGLASNDPERIDTREGTFYYDLTQSVVLELSRVWDALGTEVPAAAFPTHAWGDYLDDHAETFNLTRKAASAATGQVRVSGVAGVLVGTGTVFATEPATPDAAPIEFQTLSSLTLGAALSVPSAPSGTASSSGSFASGGTFYYFVAAQSAYGETTPSVASSGVVVTTGQKVTVTWSAVAGATGYAVYRGTTNVATAAVLVGTATTTSLVDLGNTTYTTAPQTRNGSAGGAVAIRAVETGAAGNVAAGAISVSVSGDSNLYAITNDTATAGGTEVESDEELRTRILSEYTSQGAGTVADYRRWALAYTGIGKAYVEPTWSGGGTVLVVVNQTDGSKVQNTGTVEQGNVVLGLQTQLDPTRLDTGTGTVSSLTVTDSTKAWVTNQWVGKSLVMGTKYGVVTANTATVLTVDAWKLISTGLATTAPANGVYLIGTTATSSGLGLAPIGAAVTVTTATPIPINFSATVVLKTGFTLATEQANIESSLARYFATLSVGDDVVYRRVQGTFFESAGVGDVATMFVSAPLLSISNSTADVAISAGSTPQLATLGTVTLSVSS